MFFSREKELKELKKIYEKPGQSALLFGKRRVGKTELILQSINDRPHIYFECIKDTLEENLSLFVKQCQKAGVNIPSFASFNSFIDIFDYINSLGKHYIIAIDEYPYLKELENPLSIDSLFQRIIDQHLNNISLVISGSSMNIMKDLLSDGNPLFGRFNIAIKLPELNYQEAAQFYPSLSPYDRVAMYAIFGGSPFINKEINPHLSLKENVVNTFLKEGSEVYNYANNVLISDVANELQARRLLSALSNSKKKFNELRDILDKDKTGIFNRALNSLQEVEIVHKVAPINKLNDAKKSMYEIIDNPLRFFYTYIYKNKSQLALLGPDAFYDEYILPTIVNFISLRFEALIRDYFSINVKKGILKGIKNIGTYYYDDVKNKTNGEFDIAIETKDKFIIYEAKYLKKPMNKQQIYEEIKQIEQIDELAISKIGFISINGFEEVLPKYDLISGEDLY